MTFRQDNAEDVLRQAFESQAGRVEVAPDALRSIRTRISARRVHRRRAVTMSLATLATAAAASVTAVVVGIGSCVPPDTSTISPGNPSVTAPTTPPKTNRLPVYFVGVVRGNPVLFREYHTVPAGDGFLAPKIQVALSDMLSGRALDPDYTSPWPASASVRRVQISGDAIVVDLAGASVNGADAATARAAVQQLVYTATAVAEDEGEPNLEKVRLLFDGQPGTTLWGSVNVSGTLTRAPQATTLAQVWLISPQQGDTVSTSVELQIFGTVPEATAQLRVRDASGTVVKQSVVTLDNASSGEARLTITLSPGSYTLEAFYNSLADGSVQAKDDHQITVR